MRAISRPKPRICPNRGRIIGHPSTETTTTTKSMMEVPSASGGASCCRSRDLVLFESEPEASSQEEPQRNRCSKSPRREATSRTRMSLLDDQSDNEKPARLVVSSVVCIALDEPQSRSGRPPRFAEVTRKKKRKTMRLRYSVESPAMFAICLLASAIWALAQLQPVASNQNTPPSAQTIEGEFFIDSFHSQRY